FFPFENMPASLTGAAEGGGAVAVTAAGAGAAAAGAGAGVTAAGAGVTAALSGFATPELSGGVCAPATRGIVSSAATSIQDVPTKTRATYLQLITLSPFVRISTRAARCRAFSPVALLLRCSQRDLHPLEQRQQVFAAGAVRRRGLEHVVDGGGIPADPGDHVLRGAIVGEHGLDHVLPLAIAAEQAGRHLAGQRRVGGDRAHHAVAHLHVAPQLAGDVARAARHERDREARGP